MRAKERPPPMPTERTSFVGLIEKTGSHRAVPVVSRQSVHAVVRARSRVYVNRWSAVPVCWAKVLPSVSTASNVGYSASRAPTSESPTAGRIGPPRHHLEGGRPRLKDRRARDVWVRPPRHGHGHLPPPFSGDAERSWGGPERISVEDGDGGGLDGVGRRDRLVRLVESLPRARRCLLEGSESGGDGDRLRTLFRQGGVEGTGGRVDSGGGVENPWADAGGRQPLLEPRERLGERLELPDDLTYGEEVIRSVGTGDPRGRAAGFGAERSPKRPAHVRGEGLLHRGEVSGLRAQVVERPEGPEVDSLQAHPPGPVASGDDESVELIERAIDCRRTSRQSR